VSNELRHVYGTAQTVINTTTDIANNNFSGAPTEFDNTSDAVVPHAPFALATLQMPDWGAAPTTGAIVELFMVRKNVDGTSDDTDAPSGSTVGGAQYIGAFPVALTDTLQRRSIVIDLAGVTAADFYIRNATSQNMNNDGGTACTLKITPFTYKPI
jgi:hypothetical protein